MQAETVLFFVSGISMGTTLALLPSPLLALLINETLAHGKMEGIKISLVPLVTDVIIISLGVLVMHRLERLSAVFAVISIAGFLFLFRMGLRGFFSRGIKTSSVNVKPRSFKTGIITNFLNPNPYIFWLTAGTPEVIRAWKYGWAPPAAYLGGIFLFLVGGRVVLSIVIARSGKFLSDSGYLILTRILAVILMLFGIKLLVQGIGLLLK